MFVTGAGCPVIHGSHVQVVFSVAGQTQRSRLVVGNAPLWNSDMFEFLLSELPRSFSVTLYDKDAYVNGCG